ncbi:unnamed protein product, partial [Prorocentrum cordatum]
GGRGGGGGRGGRGGGRRRRGAPRYSGASGGQAWTAAHRRLRGRSGAGASSRTGPPPAPWRAGRRENRSIAGGGGGGGGGGGRGGGGGVGRRLKKSGRWGSRNTYVQRPMCIRRRTHRLLATAGAQAASAAHGTEHAEGDRARARSYVRAIRPLPFRFCLRPSALRGLRPTHPFWGSIVGSPWQSPWHLAPLAAA